MKLQELAVVSPTKQAAKVFESYFGEKIAFGNVTKKQAQSMLSRVRHLVREHRATPEFHHSEKNPAYLKLIMLEQALSTRISEVDMSGQAQQGSGSAAGGMTPQQAAGEAAKQRLMAQQNKKQIQDQIKQKQTELQALQKQLNTASVGMAEGRSRRLREASEIQQAQVVLASQDMVDQVQKMSEQVSSMQFKDLPALVDQIKNEVGVDQATQFNGDASAALSALLQNLQGSKQQLEQALGVVTGQATGMEIPGEAPPAEPAPEMGAEELPPPPEGEEEIDVDLEEPAGGSVNDLGRGRR
jgi:DNA repair exonuclease SbcCD ATPase subunit